MPCKGLKNSAQGNALGSTPIGRLVKAKELNQHDITRLNTRYSICLWDGTESLATHDAIRGDNANNAQRRRACPSDSV